MHELGALEPEECILSMGVDVPILPCTFHLLVQQPEVVFAWDVSGTYAHHRDQLSLLARRNGTERLRWMLKSPVHLIYVRHLQQVFKDAKIVWNHRDPAQSLPSLASLLTIFETFVKGHYISSGFDQEIVLAIPKLIKATLAVHEKVTDAFCKTAATFHYEFNIRHLVGVFSGLLMSEATRFPSVEKITFLWCHECERVYGDCLVSRAHLDQFYMIMASRGRVAFGSDFNADRFYPAQPGEAAQVSRYATANIRMESIHQWATEKHDSWPTNLLGT